MLLYAGAWISPVLPLRSIISALHPSQKPADRCTRLHGNIKTQRLHTVSPATCAVARVGVVLFLDSRLRQLKIALSTCDVRLKRSRLELNRRTGLILVALTWLDAVDKSRLKPKMGAAWRHRCCLVKVSESISQYHQFCCQKITDYFQKSSLLSCQRWRQSCIYWWFSSLTANNSAVCAILQGLWMNSISFFLSTETFYHKREKRVFK